MYAKNETHFEQEYENKLKMETLFNKKNRKIVFACILELRTKNNFVATCEGHRICLQIVHGKN